MSADLALQKALLARLVASPTVTSLVPAASIRDINQRPAPSPSIIIGEGQAVEGDRIDRRDQRVFMSLHCWKKESAIVGAKAIAGAIRAAVQASRFDQTNGYHFGDVRVSSMRYLRDPDGERSHAVVTVEAIVCEVA